MKQRLILLTAVFLLTAGPVMANNYLLNGGQASTIRYQMEQSVTTTPATKKLILSYVQPVNYSSPTYNQKVEKFGLSFSPKPGSRKSQTDAHGNRILTATWIDPPESVTATLSLAVKNSVKLGTIKTTAPFPVTGLPAAMAPYLKATKQVQSDNPKIQKLAKTLTADAKTQFDAVRQILSWIVDNMRYVQPPAQYDALYAFKNGKGNCQNYSHLAAALMRAAGIPVRIVNGVTLNRPYEIKQKGGTLVMQNAQGRHSWVEAYFPDLDWVPFDPQQTELFVSNRFIRVEIGVDNEDTENDGLIRWTRIKGSAGTPTFREDISADFIRDSVTLAGRDVDYGPRNRLFGPEVAAVFKQTALPPEKPEPVPLPLPPEKPEPVTVSPAKPKPVPTPPEKPKPVPVSPAKPKPVPTPEKPKVLTYTEPFVFGNLEFPENLDFQSARVDIKKSADGSMKMVKTFLVETAEYVTTKGQKYAQSFVLTKPLHLSSVGLALHDFGRNGQLWVELSKDSNGIPQVPIATSDILSLANRKPGTGYQWVDFDFSKDKLILQPGRYWLALGFTGSPIVNWFFTYGKPTGPQDGTRYRTLFDEKWSHSLAFEFNYRVKGLIPEQFVD